MVHQVDTATKEITIVTHNSIIINIANSINAETLALRTTINSAVNIFLDDPVKTAIGAHLNHTTDTICSINKAMV